MCCVMPPASREASWLLLRLSSRVVFPWSTWPMMVTTGGRGFSREGSAGGLGGRGGGAVRVWWLPMGGGEDEKEEE